MKKITLAVLLLTGITFFACSSDDEGRIAACVTCIINESGTQIEDQVCRDQFATQEQYEQAVQDYRNVGAHCN